MSELIGPLTADEWASLRYQDNAEDLLSCCANTSDLREVLFDLLRIGAERRNGRALVDHWDTVTGHDLQDHPVMAKLHDFYIKDAEPTSPEFRVKMTEMFAPTEEAAALLFTQAGHVWDLKTLEGAHQAAHGLAVRLCPVPDPQERKRHIDQVALMTGMSKTSVRFLFNTLRAVEGLPVQAEAS